MLSSCFILWNDLVDNEIYLETDQTALFHTRTLSFCCCFFWFVTKLIHIQTIWKMNMKKNGFTFSLFNCYWILCGRCLTINLDWLSIHYDSTDGILCLLSWWWLILSFSLFFSFFPSLSVDFWSGGCIQYQKLERKINSDSNAHVHVFIHCLLKCQYQYLDRMTEMLLLVFRSCLCFIWWQTYTNNSLKHSNVNGSVQWALT